MPRNSQSPPSAVDRTSSLSAGCAPRSPGTGSGPATTWLRSRPSPSTSTSTTSPGCTGREPAGVPDSSTSPGYSVMVRAMSARSEEHTSELQSHVNLVCRLLLEKKKKTSYKQLQSKKNQIYK